MRINRQSYKQWILLTLFVGAALGAYLLTPKSSAIDAKAIELELLAPNLFGDWQQVKTSFNFVDVSQGLEKSQSQPYDKTLFRTYRHRDGSVVMLALAWGARQSQDVKVHRPEVCYPAQGFKVLARENDQILISGSTPDTVPTVKMLAGGGGRLEAVQYWIRIGEQYGGDGLAMRLYILREGLKGKIQDGILVRASLYIANPSENEHAQGVLTNFLTQYVQAVPAERRKLLVR